MIAIQRLFLSSLVALLASTDRAAAQPGCSPTIQVVDEAAISGNSATLESTVLGLLPRQPPARYTAAELADFERRLHNLGIFDDVAVACRGATLEVRVREKWTLVPELDFASGETFEDSYALLGVTEYNLFGTANQLTLSAYREQRGFGFSAVFAEHQYRRRSWSHVAELSFSTAALRFDDGGEWKTTSVAMDLMLGSPPFLSQYLNYNSGVIVSREAAHDARNVTPPPTTYLVRPYMGFVWDAYAWHDLVPSGIRADLWLGVAGVFGTDPPKPWHTLEWTLQAGLGLGPYTALLLRARGAIGTRGNVNYSFLLGSVDGVRGLRDNYYFNWAQVSSNLELRQSLDLGGRWALQGVLFTDTALFERMDELGQRGSAHGALSLGAGARLVPTWMSSVVLRLDAARSLLPEPSWFTQLGLKQYF